MPDEPTNLFDAVRKANRMVWEQAKGGGFDSSSFSDKRKENASAWDRASGKAGSESKNIPPPTGRESPLEGADASAMVAALSAKLSALQARVDYIEDDFPEHQDSSVNESAGTWTGRVMSHDGTEIASWDVTDPDNITGEWIRYDGVAGSAEFADEPDENYLCWHVADAPVAPATAYTLSTDTSGDIVLPCPKDWEDLSIFCTDEDGKLKFKKLKIKTEDPDVGLEFVEPDAQDDPAEPVLLQLKATGGNSGDVYVCGEDGAASWQKLGIKLEQVGTSGIKAILVVGATEIESDVLYGGECG